MSDIVSGTTIVVMKAFYAGGRTYFSAGDMITFISTIQRRNKYDPTEFVTCALVLCSRKQSLFVINIDYYKSLVSFSFHVMST